MDQGMKIQYQLNDYHKRIILLLGNSDKISPKNLSYLMKEVKAKQLDLLLGMSSDACSFLKTQIILKCRAEVQAEDLKAKMPEDKLAFNVGLFPKDHFSLPPLFNGQNKVIESIKERERHEKIFRELKGLEFLGIIESSLGANISIHEFAEVLLTDYGSQIYKKLSKKRNIVLRSPPSTQSSIFIASAFGYEVIDKLYFNYFKPLCEGLRYIPVRIDFKEPNNTITQAILESITETKAIIADLTFARPSVYFEVGFAQGIGVPLLLTCRKDHYRGAREEMRVHFDLEQYKISFWEYTAEQGFAWGENMAPDIRLNNMLKDN